MTVKNNLNPMDELRLQIDAVIKMIEEIIHLDAMRAALQKARVKLDEARINQHEFYESSKLPLNSANLQFLNATVQGSELQKNIKNSMKDIASIEKNIIELEHQKEIRSKPLHDLWEHVNDSSINLNKQYVTTLLNNAKTLNPEGSFTDILKSIGEIIAKIFTFRAYEVGGIYHGQKKKNELRNNIIGFFKRDFEEVKSAQKTAPKPGQVR